MIFLIFVSFIDTTYMTELEKYIFEKIVPTYAEFDSAHREDHAITVIEQALELAERMEVWNKVNDAPEWDVNVDRNILLAAAACHDLGLVNGRDLHHIDSGKIIRCDTMLRKWFTEEEIETIAQAAEDHRASGKTAPRSIYGMLVAEADRIIDGETIIRRTVQFGLDRYPELERDGHIERATAHLKEKYGRGGYLKLWIPWSSNAMRLSELQDLIADDIAIRSKVGSTYDSLTYTSNHTNMKKIYFAGSIRGGRIDADLYRRIISYIQKTDIVLTEHIGSPDLNLKEQGKKDVEIYDQDTAWLRESDLIIAECTCPSLGVGYELAYAEKIGKPCHIFYDRTKAHLSAMLNGNPYFKIHPYEKEEDIYKAIDIILNK